MPFQEMSKMHLRKQMVQRVRSGELRVAAASREYGVSRHTVYKWLGRACESSGASFEEVSRRPLSSPGRCSADVESKVLEFKSERPAWGAKKIAAVLWGEQSPVCVRTVDRILSRSGLVKVKVPLADPLRFERERPNELLQMDFKGLGSPPAGYSPLTVLDDATRFVLALEPLADHRTNSILSALWELFGEYGLPDGILTDNESCFAEISRCGPSRLEAQLWLLGIDTGHGRPRHPQTQGKVERFHRTLEDEFGPWLRQPCIQDARMAYRAMLDDYNYCRPHEAIGMRCPGSLYTPSQRRRPHRMPVHEPPEGAVLRKVDASGKFVWKGQRYRAGHGLAGEFVEIREGQDDWEVYFAGRKFNTISGAKV